ncbi:50S ribosomal protein L6 [Candidatus Curculioniphilus buchneri]|uniref:50S ribosomal protein L6 n=1 Tax=Candidatus Curculioniphilus buchneri TaxID=690594 RepID=UPI00376F260F
MSRVAKVPIVIPPNVEITINEQNVLVKGPNGELIYTVHEIVRIHKIDGQLTFIPCDEEGRRHINGWILAGTTRALLNSMIIGVTEGFTKKIQLIGVGYRAIIKNKVLSLFLGFSHHINYILPNDVIAECPSQTEIILKGINKQVIGQVAADLRSFRRPEPYKGKGIRYANEVVHTKEAKKK